MSHKSEMAGPFNRGDTIINKHFTFTFIDVYALFCLTLSVSGLSFMSIKMCSVLFCSREGVA